MTTLSFEELAARILDRPCGHRVKLVGVDGGAGAGKTTFAYRLAGSLGDAPVLQLDDFIAIDDLEDFWPRLESEVLQPLFRGQACRYRIRDWVGDVRGRALKGCKELDFSPLVVMEGVGACRQILGDRLSYAIWIETPVDMRMQRGLERDAEVEGNREIWENWMPFERAFHERSGARARADLVVDGTAPWQADRFVLLDS